MPSTNTLQNFAMSIGINVMQLPTDQRRQLYQVLTDNIELFRAVVPDVPLIHFISTGEMIDDDFPGVTADYISWKSSLGN